MIIRKELEKDIEPITKVTRAAFTNHPYSQNTEEFIIHALRAAHALTLSLVAEIDGRVVGHVAFSPVVISDNSAGWYGVGPLSVTPELQKQGIGTALMQEGLSLLKEAGAQGFVLVGDPGYYVRFGFRNIPDLVYEGIPQEYVLALPVGEAHARGTVTFHQGFSANG